MQIVIGDKGPSDQTRSHAFIDWRSNETCYESFEDFDLLLLPTLNRTKQFKTIMVPSNRVAPTTSSHHI